MSTGKVLLGIGTISALVVLGFWLKLNSCGANEHNDMGCICNDGYHRVWYDYKDGRGIQSWCESDDIPYVCKLGFHKNEAQVCVPDE